MLHFFNRFRYELATFGLWLLTGVILIMLPGPGRCESDIEGVNIYTCVPDEIIYRAEPLGDFESLTIPLKRAGRLLLIEATVDGQQGNFVFDTGATGLVLNRTYFRDYQAMNRETAHGITGQLGLVERIKVDRVGIGDLYYLNQVADMADLGHIENQRGAKILGLFGFDMIKAFEIEIDFVQSQLRLYRIDKKGDKLDAHSNRFAADCVLPIIGRKDVVIVKGEIGGEELRFCLDTGAETNALSSKADDQILEQVSITRRSTLRGAGSSGREVLFGTLNGLKVGDKQFSGLDVVITPLDHLSEVYGTSIDGMLGFSFFQNCVVCVNLKKKEVAFRFKSKEEGK